MPFFSQPLSGAPGYLTGFPLLAGVEVTDPAATDPSSTRKAVSRLASGLQLPGPGPAGRCSPSPVYAPSIGFGFNLSSSCSIGLTLAQVGLGACGLTEAALLGMVAMLLERLHEQASSILPDLHWKPGWYVPGNALVSELLLCILCLLIPAAAWYVHCQ